MKHFEVTYVQHSEVVCDGSGGSLGHPRVFLHIDEDDGKVVCPYCSKTFVLLHQPGQRSGTH